MTYTEWQTGYDEESYGLDYQLAKIHNYARQLGVVDLQFPPD